MAAAKKIAIKSDKVGNLLGRRNYSTLRFNRSKTKFRKHNVGKSAQTKHGAIPFLTALKEIRDPDEAVRLFHQHSRLGFLHDYPSYSALIYKLARCRDFEGVETILGYVEDSNVRCNETLFIILFEHYSKCRSVDKAIELFNRMPFFNCSRTSQSFNALLNVLVDNDKLLEAKEMFTTSTKMGFRLNSVPFNIMIKGWLKKGQWNEACKLFDEMLKREVEPTVVSYNSLIGYLCKTNDMIKAKELFKDMIYKGKHPNANTYAILMKGMCSIGEFKEAKKLMFDMEYRGCKPQVINFGVLMNDLGEKGNFDEAKSLLVEMKRKKFKPDVVIHNILINYLCKNGRALEAYKIFIEMQIGGCEGNAATYRTLLDGFCSTGDFCKGLMVFNAMLHTNKHFPRPETCSCLVVGLLKSRNVDGGIFVMEEMGRKSMSLDSCGWDDLIGNFCGKDESLWKLVNKLISPI